MVNFLTFNPKEPQGNDEISTLPERTSTGTMELLEGKSDGHSFFFLGSVIYFLFFGGGCCLLALLYENHFDVQFQ